MPNTLCHIALQAPLSRFSAGSVSLPFVFAACIIPDIPWVVLRLFAKFHLFPLYDLRLYTTAQASFFCCLLLAMAMSLMAKNVWLTFLVCGANCFLHLLFDAVQVKWANGVHLFGPFSWKPFQLNLLWPENTIFFILSFIGIVYLFFYWKNGVSGFEKSFYLSWLRGVGIFALGSVWLILPLFFISGVETAGNHYISVLRARNDRVGEYVEIDREPFDHSSKTLVTRTGDAFVVTGNIPKVSGILSVRGRFVSKDVIRCSEYHLHSSFRYGASIIGLFMCCTIWIHSLLMIRQKRQQRLKSKVT